MISRDKLSRGLPEFLNITSKMRALQPMAPPRARAINAEEAQRGESCRRQLRGGRAFDFCVIMRMTRATGPAASTGAMPVSSTILVVPTRRGRHTARSFARPGHYPALGQPSASGACYARPRRRASRYILPRSYHGQQREIACTREFRQLNHGTRHFCHAQLKPPLSAGAESGRERKHERRKYFKKDLFFMNIPPR